MLFLSISRTICDIITCYMSSERLIISPFFDVKFVTGLTNITEKNLKNPRFVFDPQ